MANQFGKQMANREVCDMVFVDYKTKEPFLFCDYANTSSQELTGENVFAYGGKGHPKKITFSGEVQLLAVAPATYVPTASNPPHTQRVKNPPSVLIAVLIPLMSAAPATTHCTFPFNGSNGANAPETAPTKQDFASSTPSISPPLVST